ncbi:MAG TPA: YMGG-like glycine zipper-containing protein [Gemmatimonadaceae bacterium]|nr:YMGG-like glycine zipper-containing protein [Gemmatimonadaceae bacterium]
MRNKLSTFTTPALLAAVLLLGACKRGDSPEDILAKDSTLVRDLALANADTSAQPELKDVPATTDPVLDDVQPAPRVSTRPASEAPRTRKESPVTVVTRRTPPPPAVTTPETPANTTASGNTVTEGPAGGEAAVGMIAGGSQISLYSGQRVCTNTYAVGDRFTASVAESVQGSNGVSIPAGATAVIEITSAKRSDNANDGIELEFVVRSIAFNGKTYPLTSTVTYAQVDKVRDGNTSDDARKVATGAMIGAIAGQILGKRTKSTVIGAATGAAAGAVVAGVTAKYDGCVPSGGRISLTLSEAMVVQQSE